MEQNTDAIAELVKLGADRPAYTLKLLEQYQRVLDMGIAVDNALAELKELAAENERKVAARDAAVTLHFKIRNQLELLFRAAMIEVIDQCPYFSLQRLVQENKLFDSEMEERFALRAISCGTDDAGDFVIKGKVIGRKSSRNPHSLFMGPFSAEFSGEHVYDENKVWTAQDLDACFKGVYLYQLRADADTLDELSAIHAWLNEYTVAVQLSHD